MKIPYPIAPLLRHVSRHRRFFLLMLLCVLAFLAVRGYGKWTAQQLEFNKQELPQEALPGAGPLRVAFFSDLHNDIDLFKQTVDYIEQQRPDLIIFGGDFILVNERFMRTRWAVEGLRRLAAVAPCYAILGNQDYEKQEQVERVFAAAGVRLLRNEAVDWQTPSGATLRLVGLGDWNEGDEDPARCMEPAGAEGGPVLLLSHDPESRHKLGDYRWHLMLSGHTHGGQIANPFTGACISFRSDMPAGLFEEDGRRIFVTKGVGSIMGMRFFCRPEVNLIEIGCP